MFEKIIFIAFLGLSLMPVTGRSAVVHQTSCPIETTFNCITAIDDLNILGVDYDMIVIIGEFDSLFEPPTQLLSWGDAAFSDAANKSIVDALLALSSIPTSLDTKFWDKEELGVEEDETEDNLWLETVLHIPVAFDVGTGFLGFNGECTIILPREGTPRSGPEYFDCSKWGRNQTLAFATFTTASPIPVPAAVWLFGTALIGLAGFSKRRKVA